MDDKKPWNESYGTPAAQSNAKPWELQYDKPEKPPARGFGGWARDIAATAVKGAIAVPEAVVGLADIPTGGRVGKFLENEGGAFGFRPKQAREIVNEWHSDATKEAQRKFQEADGIGAKFQTAIENPSLIATAVGESLPSIVAGGVVARGLMGATRLGQMGAKGAAAAGAIGEGATMAGSAAEQIRQETPDGLLTPTQAGAAVATGAAGAVFGYGGGRLAQRLGIGDADTMLAQGAKGLDKQLAQDAARAAANPLVAKEQAKSIPRQVIEGAISEGLFEELPQSVTEQVLQNLALGKDWHEDVDAALVLGTLSGSAMGAGAAGYRGFRAGGRPAQPAQPEQPPAAPPPVEPPQAPVLDTGRLDAELGDASAPIRPSEAMGLNPAAGPLTASAALAVDSGATDQMQAAQAQAAAEQMATKAATLQERLQFVQQQARASGWNKQLIAERNRVQRELARLQPAPAAPAASTPGDSLARKAQAIQAGPLQQEAGDQAPAARAAAGEASAVPAAAAPAGGGGVQADGLTAPAAQPEFTTVKTVDGNSVTVRTADLAGDAPRLRQYTKDGKPKAVPAIHRDNLDPTGEKGAALAKDAAANPLFNTVTRKDGAPFGSRAAAQREVNRLGLTSTHDVVPTGNGFVGLAKTETVQAAKTDSAAPILPPLQPQPSVDLQNRDRSRAASVVQMSDIARNPDYMRLGPSRTPDSGAPMVFAVGDQLDAIAPENFGRQDVAVMSDGQRVPFRYAVVDATKVNPSNFADGRQNPDFNSTTPGTIKALNNGRTAGVRAAHEMGTAGEYVAGMKADEAMHGIPAEVIARTPNPMLVRVYSDAANTANMAARSQGQGLGMSPAELARQDAPLMDSSVLGVYEPGEITSAANRDFVRAFIGKLQAAGQDVAGMMTGDGQLSQDGRKRIQAALMQAAYGDSDIVEEMFDSTDTDIKAIGEALKAVAGQWANMRDSAKVGAINPQTDITQNLIQAIGLIRKARRDGTMLYDLVNQPDLMTGETPDATTVGVLRMFYSGQYMTRAVGKDKLTKSLSAYVTAAMATSADPGMFGDVVTAGEILATINPITEGQSDAEAQPEEGRGQPAGSGDPGVGAGEARTAVGRQRAGESGSGATADRGSEPGQDAAPEAQQQVGQGDPRAEEGDGAAAARAGAADGQAVKAAKPKAEPDALPADQVQQLERDFRTFPTQILNNLLERGEAVKLYKAAGVKGASAFGDLAMDDKAAAYVKFVQQGGKPVENLHKDYNAWVKSEERAAEVRRLQSDRVVRQENGKPFKTKTSAQQFQERYDLTGTHEVKETEGGFELRQLSPAAQAELKRKAEGRESYTKAQAAVAVEMGIGQTPDGEQSAAKPVTPAAEGAPITPDEAANMQRGDIVRTADGTEFYAWSARFGRLDVVPLKDGKPQVYAGSAIRFALDDATRQANPEYRAEPLYLVRRADEQAAPAADAEPLLTNPTREDVLAQQERAENAQAADEREQIRRESEAGAGTFSLEMQDGRQDTTADLFRQTAAKPTRPAVSPNTIFTEDAAAKARERLRKKLWQLNSGLDPEMMMDGITLAGYHIEKGARTFAAYARAMLADLGDGVRPYLKSWYMGVKYDPRAAGFDGMDDAATVESADIDALTAQENDDVPGSDVRVERDRQEPAPGPAVGDAVPNDAGGSAEGNRADGGRTRRGGRRGQPDGAGVSTGGAVAGGERSDLGLPGGDPAAEHARVSAGSDFGERGSDIGVDGVSTDPIPATQVDAVATRGDERAEREQAQRRADRIPVIAGDAENIRQTLPYLLAGQQEDVAKAEARFAQPDGYGMLFTNGTGTGKTFTGLGIVKRFERQGKGNVLIVVPDDKIASDWIESGRALGLTITALRDTKDAGRGITVTTYANLGENDALVSRQWDLFVADEAHELMKSADGYVTKGLAALRALSLHPDGAYTRYEMLNRPDIQKAAALNEQIKVNLRIMSRDDTMDVMVESLHRENQRMEAERAALYAKLDAARTAVREDVKSRQGASRPRAVFLSATPFAYEFNIDWANGYLFDYNEGQPEDGVRPYNSGSNRDRFFMTHFGYTMRYNKLTKPDPSKVDTGLMQRQFNSWLKSRGVLSTRMLDVTADYDRKFVLVNSAIGNRIDEALSWLDEQRLADKTGGFGLLRDVIAEKFDYLSRRYLLEAIKATEAVPIVREHLRLGRKVVVFHDYKKGGGFNPFDIKPSDAPALDGERQSDQRAFNDVLASFREKFKDLVEAPLDRLPSPIEVFKREFHDVLLVNGDEKKADLLARYKKFQDDASGPQVMLVQSAKNKGWSGHDTTGKHQRVLINLGLPTAPTLAIQQEGRIYRTGQVSNAIIRYLNTGTNWERWAFATTIASRASTAENLAMGEQARALKDAFIAAFEESDAYPPGHEGEGTGGKARDAAANNALTAYDRAKSFYWATQKKNSKTKAQEGIDYFATPEPVGLKMAEWLALRGGEEALEPSAGHGAIARWLPDTVKRTVIEPSTALRARLAMVMSPKDDRIIDGVFEDHHVSNKYDGIVMNPPFGVGGKTAIEHLAKAATHLRDGGRIVALIPTGPAADKRYEQWMYGTEQRPVKPLLKHPTLGSIYAGDTVRTRFAWAPEGRVVRARDGALMVKVDGRPGESMVSLGAVTDVQPTGARTREVRPAEGIYTVGEIRLPQVTFERAGTKVATRIVILEKQSDRERAPNDRAPIDLTDVTDIRELFDRLESLEMPGRRMTAAQEQAAEAERAEQEGARQREEARSKKAEPGAPKAANPDAVGTGDRAGHEIIEHITQKGKTIRGIVRTDLSKEEAQKIDPYTFRKYGGWFIREVYLKPDDAPMASRGRAGGMTESAVRQVADTITSRWTQAPSIVVVPDMQDMRVPEAARLEDARQRAAGATGAPRGFYYRGTVYLVADGLGSVSDVAETLFHEALGHYGLRAVFGAALDGILDRIAMARPDLMRPKAKEYGKDLTMPKQRREVSEEVLAEMAQTNPNLGFVKRAIAAIRTWLRQNVPYFKDLALTDDEIIRNYILPARNWVERGEWAGGSNSDIRFSRSADPSVSGLPDTIEVDGVQRPTRNSEGQPIHPTEEGIRNFWRWFGSSRVVDEQGRPLVVYHGTSASKAIDSFDTGISNGMIWTSTNPSYASEFAGAKSGAVYPVFVSLQNPFDASLLKGEHSIRYWKKKLSEGGIDVSKIDWDAVDFAPEYGKYNFYDLFPHAGNNEANTGGVEAMVDAGFDGMIAPAEEGQVKKGGKNYVAFRPEQIKSATGNSGAFDPANPDIRFSRSTPMFSSAGMARVKNSALDQIHQILSHPGRVSLWDKTVGTMRHLAERSPAFKPVFEAAQRFIDDVSMLANDAADFAPRLLPRVGSWRDLTKKPISAEDNKAVAKPLFEGTLVWARDVDGKPALVKDLEDKYRNLPADQKARMLLGAGKIDPGVLRMWQGLPVEQYEAAINSRFQSQMLAAGVVWKDAELKGMFGLDDRQVSLYREARAAIDRSLDMTTRADMLRLVGSEFAALREPVLDAGSLDDALMLLVDTLEQHAQDDPDQRERLADLMHDLRQRRDKAHELMQRGYAPLSRFGRYTLDVVDANGERQYFAMFESAREANQMALRMRSAFPGAQVTQGTMSQQAYKMFAGITPETLELFGNMLGLESDGNDARDKAFQEYLRLTKNNHSALKRLIHRKGIAGYSEDVGRVLASFIYSNARQAARALNEGTLETAIEAIPKEQGELKDVAMGLRSYIQDPQEEGQAIRGMLFAQYLGGSVASAFVNMTQPFTVTMPWLSQFGGMKKAGAQLARALKDMGTRGMKYEADLARALRQAEDDGVVSPQEIHQLMAQARGTGSLRAGDGTRLGNARAAAANNWTRVKVAWGQPFALAEQFNRRITFIAAYRLAKDRNMDNPAEFARRAVLETQFVYCVDENTECLTTTGWKRRGALAVGDVVFGVDENGKAVETPLLAVHRFPGHHTVTEFANATRFSMVVTAGHRHVVQNYNSRDKVWQKPLIRTTAELRDGHHLMRAPTSAISRPDVDVDFAALLGWIAAEGNYARFRNCKTRSNVRLVQFATHNPEYVAEIEALLQRLGGHYRCFKSRKGMVLFTLKKPLSTRVLEAMPDKLLTWSMVSAMGPGEMRALLDAFSKGDGHKLRGGGWVIAQKQEQNLHVLQAMAMLCGQNATLYPATDRDNGKVAHLYLHSQSARTMVKQLTRRERTVSDGVWCPETGTGTWIARRNGAVFVTGNSKANKPQWARGIIGGTLFTFKIYSVSYLELLQRMWTQGGPEGKRAVAWALAMLLLMGGAGGLPFMEDLEDLIDAIGQTMGYNVSAKQWRKELLHDVLGKELGDFIVHGVSGLPGAPIDVSGRLGMGNLLPGTGLLLSKPNHGRDLLEVAGPAGDLVARGFVGVRKALTGDVAGAALEVSPIAVRNWAKGWDMGVSGIYKDTKGYKVIDTTLAEAASKFLGFQPRSVAEVQEANSFMQRSKSFYIQTSNEIKAQWARALFEKDEAALQRVRDRLAAWNRNNPDQKIVVKMPDVWKRVREMGKDRTQRIAETAPKALRRQMQEEAEKVRATL
jgi:hypothetical protein